MDSPEYSKPAPTTSSACETAPVQDSPVFSYISNLSPIQPVKVPSVTQGFPGLISPPLVFTSPQLNHHSLPTSLKSRSQYPGTSFLEFHEKFDDSKNSATTGENAAYRNSSMDDLIQSPSGSHGRFLEDCVKVDYPDPKYSFDSTIRASKHTDQPTDALTCSKEILAKLEHELNTGINEQVAVAPPVVSRKTVEVQNENILIKVSAAENELKQGYGVSVDHCPTIGHGLPAVNALVNQDEDAFMTELQNEEAGLAAPFDQSSQLLPGSKTFQNRGVRRRCLQFEDAKHNAICNRPAHDPTNNEGENSLSVETPLMPMDLKQYARNTLDSSIKIPKASGIGLHLNSIGNAVQAGSSAIIINVKTAQWDSVSPTTDGNKHESHACVSVDSDTALPTHIVTPANDLIILNSKANQSALRNKRKNTEKDSGLEINSLSPKKKRINTMGSGDGCKRCNCKRSKCLKLYCDCFAAGIYCLEPCSCQECFNKPEYEDSVIETQQKIVSRNPFAFAPRVVKHAIEQPTIKCGEDGSNFTPASARHKKGCKCKKSMCLKKYCECYQASVGCSDGCRCEGCKNVYGQKGENGMTKVVLTEEYAQETTDSFVQNCEIVAASGSHTYRPEFVNPHNLSPAFQFSNHGKEASKACFPSGKYIQSPESGFAQGTPSPRNSDNNITIPNDILDLVCFDQESHHGNADTVDEFSAAYPQSGKMGGHLSRIPNLQKWTHSFSAKRNHLSGSSLVWRGSPITPMAGFEYDYNSMQEQDDTPAILKDSSTSLNISPNKKKVSPPHEFRSSSSVGIRTRKFTLKAVPSFPPLTPCIDSRTPGMQQDNIHDLQIKKPL